MKKILLLFVFVAIAAISVSAQNVTLTGTQKAGRAGNNAILDGKAVTIKTNMQIKTVNCDGDGFWISTNAGVLKRFPDAKAAVGYVLKPGTYYAYPNLKHRQTYAKVELILTPKK
jgi:hypothetical protein